jgi:hypothetical protein
MSATTSQKKTALYYKQKCPVLMKQVAGSETIVIIGENQFYNHATNHTELILIETIHIDTNTH